MTEEFRVLTDREHVLHRPGVYLGSVTLEPHSGIIDYRYQTVSIVPALLKMIEEVTQNSIDEHIRTGGAHATDIRITVKPKANTVEISVADNGRGIPLHTVGEKPRPVLAWTELRAGSNFDDSKRTTAGTNGMGAALSNIFSSEFIGETCDGKQKLVLKCSDNMQNIDWKHERIHLVQSKTGVPLNLPLNAAMGNSLFDYITVERPSVDSKKIFLKRKYSRY